MQHLIRFFSKLLRLLRLLPCGKFRAQEIPEKLAQPLKTTGKLCVRCFFLMVHTLNFLIFLFSR